MKLSRLMSLFPTLLSGLLLILCLPAAAQTNTNKAVSSSVSTLPTANALASTAANAATNATMTQRPRIALVLSGGGARGFAHIGVLRALQKMRVPVDVVVGTSMGAVVGGAYAAGRTADELERIVIETDWDHVMADRPARYDLDYRRKIEDTIIPTRLELAVTKSGVFLPAAAAGNATLDHALGRLVPEGMRDHAVNQLALPFRSVASDLLTGDLVELSDTPLLASMRASLAVPGVFAPVRIKDKLVVDGGLVSNLPVELARAMGADVIIAVNVGTPLAKERDLHSAIDVATQMLQILTEQNVQRSIKELKDSDVLIAPKLDGISFLDFSAYRRAISAGENAAFQLQSKLRNYAVDETQYLAIDAQRTHATRTAKTSLIAMPITQIEVKGTQYINPQALISQTGLDTGLSLTQDQIRAATAKLYGRGDLDTVEAKIEDVVAERKVTIEAKESQSSRNRLRLGVELSSDFSDDNRFSLSVMHVASSLNRYGAELRSVARIGSHQEFSTQFWQPLAPASPWYLAPGFDYNATGLDNYSQGLRVGRINASQTSVSFLLGRQLGNWGSIEAGIRRGYAKLNSVIPVAPIDPNAKFFDTTHFLTFRADTLDSLTFPSKGSLFTLSWQRSPSKEAGEPSQASSEISMMRAFQYGDWAGHVYGEWGRSQHSNAPSALGGFLRLSGLPRNSLTGDGNVFSRVLIAKKIGALPSTVGGAIRLGFSAELGGAYGNNNSFHFRELKQAASTSLSVDTRFGPLYFGVGATRGAGSSVYLFLGPIW